MESMIHNEVDALCTELKKDAETLGHSRWDQSTVVPGFRALGPMTALSALNPGSALFQILDLVHFELQIHYMLDILHFQP